MKILTSLGLIFTFFFSAFRFAFVPTIVFDASSPVSPVSSRASGHLYGLAEAGVPDPLLVESLDISSVSQKVPDGLQHPIGDLDHVVENLPEADCLVVYLQDNYATWYYDNDRILDERREGKYDWHTFLTEDYFPKVTSSVENLREKDYADRLVYCPFNECDNGVWFGTWTDDGRCSFDEAGQRNFLSAWKETCALIRALDPDAAIGGPGYYEYAFWKEEQFLTYCRDNGCLPDVMIWHELGERSSEDWDLHVREYRALEDKLGIEEIPVIVTEYGTMEECGNPARMFRYIRQIEETGTWGNIAYWRLSDNLNDNSADGVSPNACWWLYRWYADLSGQRLEKKIVDLFHEDFGKAVKEARPARHKNFNAIGAMSDDKSRLSFLLGGAFYTGQLRITHMDATALGKAAHVKVESVTFEGLGGEVYSPTPVFERDLKVVGNALTVKLRDMDPDTVYHVEVTPATGEAPLINDSLPVRYEFERGELLGAAYTYDSAYATTGETAGMVGGMEQPGDGVRLKFKVPEEGMYDLTVVYGKHNDLGGPDGRITGRAQMILNDESTVLELPNTIKSEYTRALRLTKTLRKGENTLTVMHKDGTLVLDSLLVRRHAEPSAITVLWDEDRSTPDGKAFLILSPEDGWAALSTDASSVAIDGSRVTTKKVYLRQGLNLAETDGSFLCAKKAEGSAAIDVPLSSLKLENCALENGCLVGITSEEGSAAFTVSVPQAGEYRLTLTFANNAEGGAHAYNVDLIEQYYTVTVNGEAQRLWCRNTNSWENFATSTLNIHLLRGENTVVLFNDGIVRFNGGVNGTPRLSGIALHPVCEK